MHISKIVYMLVVYNDEFIVPIYTSTIVTKKELVWRQGPYESRSIVQLGTRFVYHSQSTNRYIKSFFHFRFQTKMLSSCCKT